MKATIFLYQTRDVEPKIITKMNAFLFGKVQQSNHARYRYEIKGVIPPEGFIRPIRAVVIVKEQFSDDIKKVFKAYGINYHSFRIEMEEGDFKKQDFFK